MLLFKYYWSRKWTGHAAHTGEMRNAHKTLSGKPKGKRLLRRSRLIQEDNIKTNINKLGIKVFTRFKCLEIWFSGRLL